MLTQFLYILFSCVIFDIYLFIFNGSWEGGKRTVRSLDVNFTMTKIKQCMNFEERNKELGNGKWKVRLGVGWCSSSLLVSHSLVFSGSGSGRDVIGNGEESVDEAQDASAGQKATVGEYSTRFL